MEALWEGALRGFGRAALGTQDLRRSVQAERPLAKDQDWTDPLGAALSAGLSGLAGFERGLRCFEREVESGSARRRWRRVLLRRSGGPVVTGCGGRSGSLRIRELCA